MESILSSLEQLPDPSEVTPTEVDLVISTRAQCHGCGNDFEKESLKRCTACKRVFYCNRDCQAKDYRKPRNHKQCCHPDLLSLAMDNIRRLPLDTKFLYNITQQLDLIPNSHFCQTVTKMSCPSVSDFIQCARREYKLVRDELCWNKTPTEASLYPGNSQSELIEHNRYGVDLGVEALCAAINMWPGVYTINSCSGLHDGAWVQTGPESYYCTDFVSFVSDDSGALNHIQAIVERGGFGIQFEVTKMKSTTDPIGGEEGFVVIDCNLDDGQLPKKCRTYGRAVSWTPEPFDKLDGLLWMSSTPNPPFPRMQSNVLGFLGVAFELVRANPSLKLSEQEIQELRDVEEPARMFRKMQIELNSERMKNSLERVDDADALAKVASEMHQRVTASSVFDGKEPLRK